MTNWRRNINMAKHTNVALYQTFFTQSSQVILYRPIAPGLCGLVAPIRSERLLYTMQKCYNHSAQKFRWSWEEETTMDLLAAQMRCNGTHSANNRPLHIV